MEDSNNFLYFMVGILVVLVGIMGFVYFGNADNGGSSIKLDKPGTEFNLQIDKNGVNGSVED